MIVLNIMNMCMINKANMFPKVKQVQLEIVFSSRALNSIIAERFSSLLYQGN